MKHFLIIWFVMANGQPGGNITEYPSLDECQVQKSIRVAEMQEQMQHGRWGGIVEGLYAVCLAAEDTDAVEATASM